MGMILQTPRRTKERYWLRKPRRSSATAQPTQQQAEKRGFARLTWKQPNNELYPGPCGRRHFSRENEGLPRSYGKNRLLPNEGGCAGMSRKMELFAARLVPQNEVYPEVLCFGSERVRSTKVKGCCWKIHCSQDTTGFISAPEVTHVNFAP
jgi:hypothetical protein